MNRAQIKELNENTIVNSELLNIDHLANDEIMLKLTKTCEANPEKSWLPAYYFDICYPDGTVIGFCDLRIGYNENIYVGGNIGYHVYEDYRGHHYSGKACLLMFELAKKHGMDHLTISCVPENIASERNLQYAGGEFVEILDVPEWHNMYEEGKRQVKVYYYGL